MEFPENRMTDTSNVDDRRFEQLRKLILELVGGIPESDPYADEGPPPTDFAPGPDDSSGLRSAIIRRFSKAI